jgi:DNA polymerase III delta prime subunit
MTNGWKVAIIPEAHRLHPSASNAMLKFLEEPLPKTLWILATTQREVLPKTIASRCFSLPFSCLPLPILENILRARGLTPEQAHSSAKLADGSASRALELSEALPSLQNGPLAAFSAADSLPKDLASARTKVEQTLYTLAQDLRLKHLDGHRPFASVEGSLREILRLRSALRANADPKLILTLAILQTENHATVLKP